MSGPNLPHDLKISLESSTILLVDDNQMSIEMLSSIFFGFGARDRHKCLTIDDAKIAIGRHSIDVLVVDGGFAGDIAFDFVRWVRHSLPEPTCFVPTIFVSGHSTRSVVRKARDAGAHFVVAKPITPGVILNRLAWIAHEKRGFVHSESYSGPDRRWRNIGVPPGSTGRRSTDLSAEVGAATEDNMSQNEINSLFKPQKIQL